MIEETPPSDRIRRFYDSLGRRYDWFEIFEGRAKARAFELLDLSPGMRLLNVGLGTGKQHELFQDILGSAGMAVGIDLSARMAYLALQRTGAPICQADACQLPFASNSFDRLYAAYVLDLLPLPVIPTVLADFFRTLKDGGRMTLLVLTEGESASSRALVALWKATYTISPLACGGCRPLQLTTLVQEAGFSHINREVVVQLAVPSEIIVAHKNIER